MAGWWYQRTKRSYGCSHQVCVNICLILVHWANILTLSLHIQLLQYSPTVYSDSLSLHAGSGWLSKTSRMLSLSLLAQLVSVFLIQLENDFSPINWLLWSSLSLFCIDFTSLSVSFFLSLSHPSLPHSLPRSLLPSHDPSLLPSFSLSLPPPSPSLSLTLTHSLSLSLSL